MKRLLVAILTALTISTAADAQWTQSMGPEGGSFSTIATTGDELLGATWRGDIYRWQATEGWDLVSSLYRPALFAAGDSYFAISDDTLYRSTDNGAHWQRTERAGANMAWRVDGDIVYVAEVNRIFRSENGGATWQETGVPDLFAIGAIWAHDSMLLVTSAGSSDIYRSGDNGATWSDARTGLPFGIAPFQFYGEASTVYMSMPSSGVFRSTDGGATWTGLNEGLPNYEGSYPMMSDMVINDGKIFGALSDGIYFFDGSAWTKRSGESNVLFETQGGVTYKASRTGVERSEHRGDRWTPINTGLRAVDITTLTQIGPVVVAGSSTGIHTSSDNGTTWQRVLGNSVDELVSSGSVLLARGWQIATTEQASSPGILRSSDNGATWQNSSRGIGNELNHISTIAANSTTVFAGFHETFGFHGVSRWQAGGVHRSTDNGATWRLASSGLPSDGFSLVPIIDIVATDEVVIATTIAGLYRSTDNGESWQKSSTAPSYDDGIGAMAVDGNTIYLAVRDGIFISTDKGATWSPMETGFEQFTYIYNMQIVGSDLIVFTNQSIGFDRVFRFDGTTWENINDEFPAEAVFRTFLISGNRMLGGTAATSVWSQPVETTTSVAGRAEATTAVSVEPNPFGAGTTITLELLSRSHVRLDIVDMTGERVATLRNESLESGRHVVALDGADLPAGRYLYRLSIDGVISGGSVVKW